MNNYVTILLITAVLLALINFTATMAKATPKKYRERATKQNPRVQKIKKKNLNKNNKGKRRKLRSNNNKRTTNPPVIQQKPKLINNKKKITITIHKKGKAKKQCDKLCQHRSRHIRLLLRLGHDVTDSYDLRLRTPNNKRNTIKKRGQ